MPSYSKESTSASLASKHCLSLGQTTPKSLHRRYLCHGASKKNNESSYLTLHNGCGSSKKRDTGRSHLPDNWIGLMGVSDLLEQFSKDDIKRQEVSICTVIAVLHVHLPFTSLVGRQEGQRSSYSAICIS